MVFAHSASLGIVGGYENVVVIGARGCSIAVGEREVRSFAYLVFDYKRSFATCDRLCSGQLK